MSEKDQKEGANRKPILPRDQWQAKDKKAVAYLDPDFGKKGRATSLWGADRNSRMLNAILVLLVLLLCGIILLEKGRKVAEGGETYKELNLERPDRSDQKQIVKRSLAYLDQVIESTITSNNSIVAYDGQSFEVARVDATFDPKTYRLNFLLSDDTGEEAARVEIQLVETATHAYAPDIRSCGFRYKFGIYTEDVLPCNYSSEVDNVVLKDFYLNGPLRPSGTLEYLLSASVVDGTKDSGWNIAGTTNLVVGSSDGAEDNYLLVESLDGQYTIAGNTYQLVDAVGIVRPRLDRIDITFFKEELSIKDKKEIISRESATRRNKEEIKPVANLLVSFAKDKRSVVEDDVVRVEGEFMNPEKPYRASIEHRISRIGSEGIDKISATLVDKSLLVGKIRISEGGASVRASFSFKLIEIY